MSAYVYRIFDGDTDELLYIGSSINPRVRFFAHKKRDWWPTNPRTEQEEHPDRETAYAVEKEAIAAERPPHNIDKPPDPEIQAAAVRRALAAAPRLSDEKRARIEAMLSVST